MKLIKVARSLFAVTSAALLGVFSAFADEPISSVTVLTASVDSYYTIVVPETVALKGATSQAGTYTGSIPVTIKGDIEEDAQIEVTATATTMNNAATGETNPVTFTQTPKNVWARDEILDNGTTVTYVVSCDLTPGSWRGTATFSCTYTLTAS